MDRQLLKLLTMEATWSTTYLPCVDPGFEWAIGVTGKDSVFSNLGAKILLSVHVDLSLAFPEEGGDAPKAKSAAFSISMLLLLLFLFLKVNFGIRLFRLLLGLFLEEDEQGLREAPRWKILGLGIGEKLTLLPIGLDVKDALRLIRSSPVSCGGLDETMPRLHSCSSSAISAESPSLCSSSRALSLSSINGAEKETQEIGKKKRAEKNLVKI